MNWEAAEPEAPQLTGLGVQARRAIGSESGAEPGAASQPASKEPIDLAEPAEPSGGLVMAWPGKLASRDIRRLQLAAEAGSNVCVLFRERRYADQNSPAALRLELEPGDNQELKINIVKRRGSWPGQRCALAMAQRADLTFHEAPRVVQGPWSASTR